MTTINGKVAVVTGGASGIGRGIAEQLISEGATVIIADIDADAVGSAAESIGAHAIQTDVSEYASVAALAEQTVARFGSVDIIVNNAGVGPQGKIADLSLQDWRWILDVNLYGVIHGIHAFLPLLVANPHGGHIVNTASMAAFSPLAGLGAYTASKYGVLGLSEVLASEMAEDHPEIHVSVLCPGPVLTNIKNSLSHRPATSTGALVDVNLETIEGGDGLRWAKPRTVGRVVAQAIRNNDFLALTHPEWWPMVAAHNDRMQGEFSRYEPDLG